jgi:hypothetical protein
MNAYILTRNAPFSHIPETQVMVSDLMLTSDDLKALEDAGWVVSVTHKVQVIRGGFSSSMSELKEAIATLAKVNHKG